LREVLEFKWIKGSRISYLLLFSGVCKIVYVNFFNMEVEEELRISLFTTVAGCYLASVTLQFT